MKKFLKSFVLALLIVSFFPKSSVHAISITPSSGNIQPGYNLSISIVASGVPSDSSTMQLNLSAIGSCSITSYTPPSGGTWGLSIPLCTGGASFTASSVCIALSKTSPNLILNGESLGTMVVNCSTAGSLVVSSTSGSGYVSGGTLQERVGTLGTFSVSGNIPNTALSFTDVFSLLGIFSLIFGIFLFITVKKERNNKL